MAKRPHDWSMDWHIPAHGINREASHSSGLVFHFEHTTVNAKGDTAWTIALQPSTKADELKGTLGQKAFSDFIDELSDQAFQLWAELGYSDHSPERQDY
jgi:hypothetical protein